MKQKGIIFYVEGVIKNKNTGVLCGAGCLHNTHYKDHSERKSVNDYLTTEH